MTRGIIENISSVILQAFLECGRDQARQKRRELSGCKDARDTAT